MAPLRRLRRDLKTSAAGPARRRERLRAAVRQLELQAERMLLEMLEDASPPADGEALPAAEALARAAAPVRRRRARRRCCAGAAPRCARVNGFRPRAFPAITPSGP